jgi:hypothetical protein
MPGSSNTSFIPKRNPDQRQRSTVRKQVYVGTFIIRILFFAALLSAVGVYIYDNKLKGDLDEEVASLSNAIVSFNEAEMQRVMSTDLRLVQANYRLGHSVAVTSVLGAIEKAVIKKAQITGLGIKRVDDSSLEVSAEMKVDSFDSALFQKNVLEEDQVLAVNGIKDLTLERTVASEGGPEVVTIAFLTLIGVAANDVSHTAAFVGSASVVVPEATTPEDSAEVAIPETEEVSEEADQDEVVANDETI